MFRNVVANPGPRAHKRPLTENVWFKQDRVLFRQGFEASETAERLQYGPGDGVFGESFRALTA